MITKEIINSYIKSHFTSILYDVNSPNDIQFRNGSIFYPKLIKIEDQIHKSDKISKLRNLNLDLLNNENKKKILKKIEILNEKIVVDDDNDITLMIYIDKMDIEYKSISIELPYLNNDMIDEHILYTIINEIKTEIDLLFSNIKKKKIYNYKELYKTLFYFNQKNNSNSILYGDDYRFEENKKHEKISFIQFNDLDIILVTPKYNPLVLYIDHIDIIENINYNKVLNISYYVDIIGDRSNSLLLDISEYIDR